MKMTKLRLNGITPLELPILGAKLSDPYICKAVDGLGPTDVTVHMSDRVVQGSYFQGRRAVNREVVMRVGLNPNYILGEAPSDLRQALYGLITPDNDDGEILIEIMDGLDVVAFTTGWVKKFETVLFTKEPEVQITFACPEPYLSSDTEVVVPVPNDNDIHVINQGTAPTGFEVTITVTEDTSFIRMVLGDKEFRLDPLGRDPFGIDDWYLVGDELTIDTNIGSRKVWFKRGATEFSGLYMFKGQWPMLRGGDNLIDVLPDAKVSVGPITYTPKYWGI